MFLGLIFGALILGSSVSAHGFQISDIEGSYGSRRFYGRICTWEPCRRPDMYRKHELQVEFAPQQVTLRFLTEGEEFRLIHIPTHYFKYYEQHFGGYSEGLETYFFEPPVFNEVTESEGFTVVKELIPVMEIRFVKFKNKPEDDHHLYGYEHIEGSVLRTTILATDGAVISQNEEPGPQEISTQYMRDRAALPPNF